MSTTSIGAFAKNLILTTQLSNTQILEKVKEQFPAAKTSMACIAWYKSDLRKKNILNDKKVVELSTMEKLLAITAQIEELQMKQLELQEQLKAEVPVEEEETQEEETQEEETQEV